MLTHYSYYLPLTVMKNKLILLMFMPLAIKAQTNLDAQNTHQHSVSLLQKNNPKVEIINVSELQMKQKGLHENCTTCDKNKKSTINNTNSTNSQLDLDQLLLNQDRIVSLINNLLSNNDSDTDLLEKYKNALKLNQQKIRLAQASIASQKKEINEIKIKESK